MRKLRSEKLSGCPVACRPLESWALVPSGPAVNPGHVTWSLTSLGRDASSVKGALTVSPHRVDVRATGDSLENASQVALVVKNLLANAGDIRDTGLIPGSGRSPGGGIGNPLWYSCPENSMDRGAWLVTVHRVAKSWTREKQLSTHMIVSLHRVDIPTKWDSLENA